MRYETLWEFNTERFTVQCRWADEIDPDTSWMDEEQRSALECGLLTNCMFEVRVLLDGREVAADYLGNSVYAKISDFVTAHRDPNPEYRNTEAMKARNRVVCHYFPDMVRQAIAAARKELSNTPNLRRVITQGRVA